MVIGVGADWVRSLIFLFSLPGTADVVVVMQPSKVAEEAIDPAAPGQLDRKLSIFAGIGVAIEMSSI